MPKDMLPACRPEFLSEHARSSLCQLLTRKGVHREWSTIRSDPDMATNIGYHIRIATVQVNRELSFE